MSANDPVDIAMLLFGLTLGAIFFGSAKIIEWRHRKNGRCR